MGRLGRGQVAGLLSVLFVLGAAAFAVAAQPQATGVLEAVRQRLAIHLVNLPLPLAPAVCPPGTSAEHPALGGRGPSGDPSGPTTCAAEIVVAGSKVRLPPDAYVADLVSVRDCVERTPCGMTTIYVLRRGESEVLVSQRTGTGTNEKIAPGEEGAFDFLPEVVP
jgi:hypothetical protein